MQSANAKPRATVIIEWENVQLAEQTRCLTMLRTLSNQIGQLQTGILPLPEGKGRGEGALPVTNAPSPCPLPKGEGFDTASHDFELLVLYDNEECEIADVRGAVEPCFGASRPNCRVRFVPAPHMNYYQQKNLGTKEASSDIIVFLDSDVIPEAGWLENLLSPFADPKVHIVSGNSFLSTSDAYSKAFALFWFFPLRAEKVVFEERRTFFANNVAFRRNVLLKHPFPTLDGTTRGSCLSLARQLRAEGIGIYHNSAAQVSHPAPNGFSHFVVRALADGRDSLLVRRALGKGSLIRTLPKSLLRPFRALWKILRYGHKVNLSWLETPAALAIAISYEVLAVAGEILTRFAPAYTQSRWKV